MIVAGSASPLLLASAAGGYNLTNSLRFRSSASAYLNRTPASAGNRRTWTWSAWVKLARMDTGETRTLFSSIGGTSDDTYTEITITAASRLYVGGYNTAWRASTAVFRDPSAWYHIVVALDTTQATASNRMKIYVNGSEVTDFSTSNNPSLNQELGINLASQHRIGDNQGANYFFDGYMTEINFIDGQALTPSSFGETNAKTGVWQPKKYAGTYGTNGFYLPFTDNSALTTSSNVGLGKDFSGNGNYWVTDGISITAGSTYDSMTDVPTLTSATAANFAVMNPLRIGNIGSSGVLSNANLTVTDGNRYASIAYPSSGKYYTEASLTFSSGDGWFGIFVSGGDYIVYKNDGIVEFNGSTVATGASYTTGDVVAMTANCDTNEIKFYKNNSLQHTETYTFTDKQFTVYCSANSNVWNVNFGQRPFAYTPPTGFVALNTFNLPEPTIGATATTQANKYFDATTYTGNGSTQSITNSGSMQPDWVWIKGRSDAWGHALYDVIRGVDKRLNTNNTNAESTTATGLTSFNSNGFSLSTNGDVNLLNDTYVGWQWRANGTGTSNTDGSITSTVSANTSAGFSVVTYTGTGTTTSSVGTIGHGLGVAPKMIIVKNRGTAGENWIVYHASLGATKGIELNLTNAATTYQYWWQNQTPTSSVFSVGYDFSTGANGQNYVAYCFAEIAGYSKFGSYTGNGSTDGTFVYTGFRPEFVLIRDINNSNDWYMHDSARNPSNVVDLRLSPNLSNAEVQSSVTVLDFLSNGFKLRTSNGGWNGSGNTYIYMAFAENPFKYSLAR